MFSDLSEFDAWLADRRAATAYDVTVAGLDGLDGWRTEPETGDLVHRTGGFFTVTGIQVETDHREVASWTQPIIVQREVGILGLAVRRVGGVLHCLLQAKMEPGNVNGLQLSPTVQATRSNYRRVHRGHAVPYLEYFLAPRRGRVVFDALQSEQGSWFLGKRNRNMVVEVDEAPPLRDNFCWLSLDQLRELLRRDNVVNMDSRSVLAGLAPPGPAGAAEDAAALHTRAQLLSWFTEAKTRYRLERRVIPLARVRDWTRSPEEIRHDSGEFFRIIGVDVQAGFREVARWSQPMLAPASRGVSAFVARWIRGALHLLVHAQTEAGTGDLVEMSPTVNCAPANYRLLGGDRRPRFLDYVLSVPRERRMVDVIHSEEGGRFYHAENRYLVVLADDDFPVDVPEDFVWMTIDQLTAFVQYGNHVNVSARSILSCLAAGAGRHEERDAGLVGERR
ncbi:oxidase EvaA [Krasilnikovia cinnamomea]|uniref:Oxidase EvaA n=1 Tax=Krasilnikovia cinnamomea TaxID=349313 RepID=A0A4Q7ZKZ1_9ACTN|nr:NDP-hexose 2,3-dehydratase family protein [Krasilnikovia cinnamomea]RZU51618.1 oxidase EvaA [Krasilnikovia cinnamomea]